MAGDGELVEVAFVGDEYEAAMVQALLDENGIPSIEQRVGIDGATLGYAVLSGGGSRRVMVHSPRAEEARALLAEARAEDEQAAPEPVNARYLEEARGSRLRNYGWAGAIGRLYLVVLIAMAGFVLAFGIFLLLRG